MNKLRIAKPAVPLLTAFDLVAMGLLPAGWCLEVLQVAKEHASDSVLKGGQSTSLEDPGVEIPYRLVVGDLIAAHLPWLDRLYRNELTSLATTIAGHRMMPSSSVTSGVNLNILVGSDARYEWHVDSNPLTGVLFITTHDVAECGGELLFRPRDGREHTVRPRAGVFMLFDARAVPHTVLPLREPQAQRVSAPMNFYMEAGGDVRPAGLDEYLYPRVAARDTSVPGDRES